jgi:hypothetical protein
VELSYQQRAEVDICHAYLNALGAAVEGRHAMITMLNMLAGEGSYAGELSAVRELREQVSEWTEALWNNQPLPFTSGEDAFTPEVIDVLDGIDQVKEECYARAQIVDRLLEKDDLERYPEALYMLVSLLAYQAYSRDYYIKGLVQYGEIFGPSEVAANWREQLPSCEKSIATARKYYDLLLDNNNIDDSLIYQVTESTILLPAIFRCQAHDINQIHGILGGDDFNFFMAEIDPSDAEEWAANGFSPRAAGYWRAYGMRADEVITWLEKGFYQPGIAGAWKFRGFDPTDAMVWSDQGYTAKVARFYSSLGCDSPSDAEKMQQFGN